MQIESALLCNFILVTSSKFRLIPYCFRDVDTFCSRIACFTQPTFEIFTIRVPSLQFLRDKFYPKLLSFSDEIGSLGLFTYAHNIRYVMLRQDYSRCRLLQPEHSRCCIEYRALFHLLLVFCHQILHTSDSRLPIVYMNIPCSPSIYGQNSKYESDVAGFFLFSFPRLCVIFI